MRKLLLPVAALVLVSTVACGDAKDPEANRGDAGDDPSGDGSRTANLPSKADPDSYLPLRTGNRWIYKVTAIEAGVPVTFMKENFVGERTKVGGTGLHKEMDAFLVTTIKNERKGGLDRKDKTESFQDLVGDRFVRYREISYSASDNSVATRDETYDPARLRLDVAAANLVAGATFEFLYNQFAIDKSITIPMTAHREVWTVEKVDDQVSVPVGTFTALKITKRGGIDASKTWWYARGIGKIKEEGGQLEELQGFDLR